MSDTAAADLLLVNASNYAALPIYPYAFVQVSAVAEQHGVRVRGIELLGTPRSQWRALLADAIRSARPRMIGVHLRQADSLFIWDYAENPVPGAPDVVRSRYFPVAATQFLIGELRQICDLPIVLGGFGFTTHAIALLDRLRPDFGVLGEPDDFLAKFGDVVARHQLPGVANLAYRSGDRYEFNKRVYYGPHDHPEYTREIIADLAAFYGKDGVTGTGGAHVPVEIQRGCPHRCYFCTEPVVKGRRHRTRDLDAVMADIQFLARHDIGRVWLVCSEINIGGNELLFEMARRMRDTGLTWSSYLLPNPALARDQIRLLLSSGFEPGWNQFMSYDDANLKATRVPYRARHAVRAQADWAREAAGTGFSRLDMFLGNIHTTPATIAGTLELADQAGLTELFDSALVTRATRVFPHHEISSGAFSLGPDGPLDRVDLLYPTFAYPPGLLDRLGSAEAVDQFFAHVEDTYLSAAHRAKRNWCAFLADATSPDALLRWCSELSVADSRQRLLDKLFRSSGRRLIDAIFAGDQSVDSLARSLAVLVSTSRPDETGSAFAAIGLPGYGTGTWSAYSVAKALAERYASTRQLMADLERRTANGADSLAAFCVRLCLFENNVKLRPDYNSLLFDGHPRALMTPDSALDHGTGRTRQRTWSSVSPEETAS